MYVMVMIIILIVMAVSNMMIHDGIVMAPCIGGGSMMISMMIQSRSHIGITKSCKALLHPWILKLFSFDFK